MNFLPMRRFSLVVWFGNEGLIIIFDIWVISFLLFDFLCKARDGELVV